MAETANRSRGSGRRVRGAFAPEARCGYRNPTLSSILATQMPCRTPSRSEALRSATDALRRLLARRSAGAVLKPSGGNCAVLPQIMSRRGSSDKWFLSWLTPFVLWSGFHSAPPCGGNSFISPALIQNKTFYQSNCQSNQRSVHRSGQPPQCRCLLPSAYRYPLRSAQWIPQRRSGPWSS